MIASWAWRMPGLMIRSPQCFVHAPEVAEVLVVIPNISRRPSIVSQHGLIQGLNLHCWQTWHTCGRSLQSSDMAIGIRAPLDSKGDINLAGQGMMLACRDAE